MSPKKNYIITAVASILITSLFWYFFSGHGFRSYKKPKKHGKLNIARHKENLEFNFSELKNATLKIMETNNNTLEGVFKDNDAARDLYGRQLGRVQVQRYNFQGFNPECKGLEKHGACGKVLVRNKYILWVMKNGVKKDGNYH